MTKTLSKPVVRAGSSVGSSIRPGPTPLVRMVMGTCLRSYRNEGRWTLRDVADRARVSPGYLSEIERGRKEVSSELIDSVCEALGITVSQLLIDTGQRLAACEAIRTASLKESDQKRRSISPLHIS